MSFKHLLIVFVLVSVSIASMPYRGTIQSSGGAPVKGAKIVAITNRKSTVSNNHGQFGSGVTSVQKSEIVDFEISKPLLAKDGFYFTAHLGEEYSFVLVDIRGRQIVDLHGKTQRNGLQSIPLSPYGLADGFYITVFKINDTKFVTKNILTGNVYAPQQNNMKRSITNGSTTNELHEISLVDTLYISAKGYKNKKVVVSDTGSVGTIILDVVGNIPEIYCENISLAYTPDKFPRNRNRNVALNISLFNGGGANASAVSCSLVCHDPIIGVYSQSISFGEIVAGSSKGSEHTFNMIIPRDYEAGKNIPFKLFIADSLGNTWDCAELYMVYPFKVVLQKMDDDTLGGSVGNNNGKWDKGEVVEYTPVIKNMSGKLFDSLTLYWGKSYLVDTSKSNHSNNPELKQDLGQLKVAEEKMTPLDFQISTSTHSQASAEEDLLVKADEYFLLPIDLNDKTMETPEPTTAELKGAYCKLAYNYGTYHSNRGDSLIINIGIENVHSSPALSVACSLEALTENITVGKDGYLNFDNVTKGDTSFIIPKETTKLKGYYNITVPRDYPAGSIVEFALHIKDSWGSSWIDTIEYIPHPFAISDIHISDDSLGESLGDNDGKIEVGETVEFRPHIQNFTPNTFEELSGKLIGGGVVSITFPERLQYYGTVEGGGSGSPENDYLLRVWNLQTPITQSDLLLFTVVDGDSAFYILPLDLMSDESGRPIVSIMNDTVISPSQSLQITATAFDYDGVVEKYVWALDGENYRDTTEIGEIEFSKEQVGTNIVKVKVIDDEQKISSEDVIVVSIRGETFSKTYAGGGGSSVAITPDGGYVVAGYKKIVDSHNTDLWVLKVDSNGDTLWTKEYGGLYEDRAMGVDVYPNGDILVIGHTANKNDYTDIWVLKLDSLGDTLWTKTYGGDRYDHGNSLKILSDNSAVLVGRDNVNLYDAIWVTRIDVDGQEMWSNRYRVGTFSFGESILEDSEKNLIITGRVADISRTALFAMKLTPEGESLWEKSILTQTGWCHGFTAVQMDDSGYIVSGKSDAYLYNVKFDSEGNYLWSTEHGWFSEPSASVKVANNSFITVGHNRDVLELVKFDAFGKSVWEKQFEDFGTSHGKSIISLDNGSFVVTGFRDATDDSGNGGDLFIANFNADGSLNE